MAYKTLLTFHAIEQPIKTLDSVIELAREANAHLDILVLGVTTPPPVTVHNVGPAAEWAQFNIDVINDTANCAEEIEQHVAKAGISASVVPECDYLGLLGDAAARYALCSDVVTLTKSMLEANASVEKAFNSILFQSGCPFLLLPDGNVEFSKMSKVAIAWNGRAEAAKAIHRALPLLKKAESVNVIIIDPKEADVGEDPGNDIAAFLARYNMKVTVDILPSGGKTVHEKLLQRVRDIDADLLVMGAYGHTKFREWLVGGATRDMLKTATVPVFMVH